MWCSATVSGRSSDCAMAGKPPRLSNSETNARKFADCTSVNYHGFSRSRDSVKRSACIRTSASLARRARLRTRITAHASMDP